MRRFRQTVANPPPSVKLLTAATAIFIACVAIQLAIDVDALPRFFGYLYRVSMFVGFALLGRGLMALYLEGRPLRKIQRLERQMHDAYDYAMKAQQAGQDDVAAMFIEQHQLFYLRIQRERAALQRELSKMEKEK